MAKRKNWTELKIDCILFHNNKYDYSKVNYINYTSKVEIICPVHGSFFQTIQGHKKMGCSLCGRIASKNKQLKLNEDVLLDFNKVHKDKYKYSKMKYVNNCTKIEIICPLHGSFFQLPTAHISGSGCPGCAGKNKTITEIISDFSWKNKDYSKMKYVKQHEKIEVICTRLDIHKKQHGSYFISPNNHKNRDGCPKCSSSKGELRILNYLEENNIKYIKEKVLSNKLRFDFFIEEYQLAIEFDGIQHYEAVPFFGGKEGLIKTQERDKIKDKYCIDNNINSLRIDYRNIDNIEEIIKEEIEYLRK